MCIQDGFILKGQDVEMSLVAASIHLTEYE